MAAIQSSQYDPLKAESQDPATYLTTPAQNQKTIGEWPQEPRSLQQSMIAWLFSLSPHVLILLLPLCSVGLAIGVLQLDKRPESNAGNAILQALAVSATIWPILFAAVIGPLVKAIALYNAQRGTTLGVLEILYTSQTLVSTLRGCFSLRIVSLWPVILVLIWSLSPIGGQAALRAATLSANFKAVDYALSSYPYSDLRVFKDGPFNSGVSGGASLMNQYRVPAWAAFTSQDLRLHHANGSSNSFAAIVEQVGGLEEAVKMTQRDLWRNVRIPFIHSLPGYKAKQEEWIAIQSGVIPDYSSLIGVPIRGFPSLTSGNASSIIQTSYQTLTCNTPWAASQDVMDVYGGSVLNWTSGTCGVGMPNLMLNMINDPEREDAIGPTDNEAEPPSQLRLMIGTYKNRTVCEVRTEYVQAQIRCSRAADNADLACSVERMRHDPNFAGSENLTALDIGRNYMILQQIPCTFPDNHPGEPSILETWLKDPTTAFDTGEFLNIGSVEFWYKDISLRVFADRLAMVLNTHLRASLQMSYIVGSDGSALKNESQSWAQTNGTWVEQAGLSYQLNKAWFLLYLLSAIVLVICALANIVLRTIIHIPDFLDSVSALTRDSNYIHVATPGSTLNGIDRSRLLRDKHIMVQNVQPENEVGRIALSDSLSSIPVQQDRLYI